MFCWKEDEGNTCSDRKRDVDTCDLWPSLQQEDADGKGKATVLVFQFICFQVHITKPYLVKQIIVECLIPSTL